MELTHEQIDAAYRAVWSTLPSNNRLARFAHAIYALAKPQRKWVILLRRGVTQEVPLLRRSVPEETMTFIAPNRVEYTITEKELADTPEAVRTVLRQMALELSGVSVTNGAALPTCNHAWSCYDGQGNYMPVGQRCTLCDRIKQL